MSVSKPPKTNSLFFTHGPPIDMPVNSSLLRGGPVKPLHTSTPGAQAALPGLLVLRCVLLSAFRNELVSRPKMLPCHTLVPDLVMMLITEPALRPYSGPKLLVVTTYCCTNSGLEMNSPGPPTLLSLLF